MRGLFIYNKRINYNNLSGIDKKVVSQVEAINREGVECSIYELNDTKRNRFEKLFLFLKSRFLFSNGYPSWNWDEKFGSVDFIYLRRPDSLSKDMIKVLCKAKKVNPSLRIIMEVPNYPYESELGFRWYNRPLVYKDRYYRKKIEGIIDRIAIQNAIDELFGIKTLQFINGIKMSEITVRNAYEANSDVINICAVASLEPWQGYERIFYGLSNYYKAGGKRKIKISIAGIGSEMDNYKSIVNQLHLGESIEFLGRLSGENLQNLYDRSDLALDAFGRFKTGNTLSTSLKSREYLAKGMPIITGCKTDVLREDFGYFLEFSNDDSIIEFSRIISFYDSIYNTGVSRNHIIKTIRRYAEETCDISRMMSPIIDYLKTM